MPVSDDVVGSVFVQASDGLDWIDGLWAIYMAWYLRLYKSGPYAGLQEKGVGARGGLSLLQADGKFMDDSELLALAK